MDERRKNDRRGSRRFTKPLRILVFWKGKSGRHEAYMCDVGVDGCFLNTVEDAEAGEHITVEIPKLAGDQKAVTFHATVVPQERKFKGFGVRFMPLSEDQLSVLTPLLLKSREVTDRRR